MFSKSLNLRLAAVFSGIFLAGTLLLFAGTYLLLYSSVRREHIQQVQARLLEFWAMYQTGGIAALKAEVVAEKNQESRRPFLLRVVGSDNATLFLYVPPPWRHFHFRDLEEADPARPQAFLRLPLADGKGALELAGLRLDDGNWLQVGFHSADWQELLVRFRQVFILIAAPLLVLSFLGGALASSRALRPVQHLTRAFQSIIRTGRLDARVPERGGGGELDALVSLYNGMLAKIETLVNGMRGALDNVAHDLRTPLARLKAAAETALAGPPSGQRRALESCLEETADHPDHAEHPDGHLRGGDRGHAPGPRARAPGRPDRGPAGAVRLRGRRAEHHPGRPGAAGAGGGRRPEPPAAGHRQPPGQRAEVHARRRAGMDRGLGARRTG